MLSLAAMSSGQASYYLDLAQEDYYLKGGEPEGLWYGEGATRLGLIGFVKDEQLYNLFKGYDPEGARPLVQLQRKDDHALHRPGWDLTFSAPKSVSVLWSQASPDNQRLIQLAHLTAVQAAIDYLQDTAAFSRVGRQGRNVEQAHLVTALFEHSTSRALDPQLHTHALFLNLGVCDDGNVRTLSSLPLFLSKMSAGALYRTELSYQLGLLGIDTERHRSWFEVTGVAPELVEHFSKRRQEIEQVLKEKGLESPEAAVVAAIETRESKESVSRSELIKSWLEEGAAHGWTREHADKLLGNPIGVHEAAVELASIAVLATDEITGAQAHFTRRDFVRFMAEQSQCRGVSASQVLAVSEDHLENSSEIVRLGIHYGEERFTTRKMLELEAELLASSERLREDASHAVASEVILGVFSKQHTLSEEQLKAVWHVTTETGAIAVVSGMAGTGKTRMLEAAKNAWQAEGLQVIGAAVAARAASQLTEGAGIESLTLAKLLHEIGRGRDPLSEKSVVVLDEAGMVATPQLHALAQACLASGAKLVLVGDERQLQPIGPGAPFMELGSRFGQAELQDIRRQDDAWARRAVKDLAEGNARAALDAFVEHGLVHVSTNQKESMRALIEEWRSDGKPVADSLILAGSNREVAALNLLAQKERKESGELGSSSALVGGHQVFEGDRVIFTSNHRAMGVLNGDRGTIKGVLEKGSRVVVSLDSGEQVSFDPEALPDCSLGYATTTHKAQGATAACAYILAGGSMQDRELSYVQASRSREKTVFFMTESQLGDGVAELARQMERSRQKEMAHTVLREIDQDLDYD